MGNEVTRSGSDRNIIVAVSYDKAGRMTSLRDPLGHETTYSYDNLDRRTQLTSPAGQQWDHAYTELPDGGRTTTQTYPGINGGSSYDVTRTFDPAGRLESIVYGDPANTPDVVFGYDIVGNRLQMTEFGGAGFTNPVRQTDFSYDDARRLTGVATDRDGVGGADETVSYSYDAGGKRARLTLDDGVTQKSISYEYDAKGQLVALTDFDANRSAFAYDRAGRHVATSRGNGLRSRYRYDKGSRLRDLRHYQNHRTLSQFRYDVDGRGNRTTATELLVHPDTTSDVIIPSTDPSVVYTGAWTTNGLYRETSERGAKLKVLVYGQGDLKLTVASAGWFDVYVGGAFYQAYFASSEREIVIPLTHQALIHVELRNRSDNLLQFKQIVIEDVSYDLHTIQYTYDALSRLTQADYHAGDAIASTPLWSHSYGYDEAGNLVNLDGVTRTYNSLNQMTNDGTDTLTYDANGNLRSDGVTSYTWDRANRMTAVGGTNYAYDGQGQRMSQTVSGVVTDYINDSQPGLSKVIAATTSGVTEHYVHSPRGVHAQRIGGVWVSPMQDGLGSVRSVVDANVQVHGVQSYDPYGDPFGQQGGAVSPFGFTGEMTDGNGQVYLRARYYDPGLGTPFMARSHRLTRLRA